MFQRGLIATYLAMIAVSTVASAGSVRAEDRLVVPPSTVWKSECGACHLAYPPQLLPARSWRAIIDGLDKHFGVDASLDPTAAAEIRAFLERNGGRDRGDTAALRITETAWFRRKHREVAPAVWSSGAVKRAGNCAACHRGAEQGSYDEETVRLPR